MEFAIQRCCSTSVFLEQYESSTDAVLNKLGVGFKEIKEFNCCGYPVKNVNFKAHMLASARNLSLAERENLNILTLCNCCYGTLKHVSHTLKEDDAAREEINRTLGKEGLRYKGNVEVRHLADIFHKDIGVAKLKEKMVKTFEGLKIATHYGCHILRPRKLVSFNGDGETPPSLFDELVEITGAKSLEWSKKMDCCGSPVLGVDDDLSMDLTEKKILNAEQSGADMLCVFCPFCQLQFDRIQKMIVNERGKKPLPSISYIQLIGLSLGIGEESLGIQQNELELNSLQNFL